MIQVLLFTILHHPNGCTNRTRRGLALPRQHVQNRHALRTPGSPRMTRWAVRYFLLSASKLRRTKDTFAGRSDSRRMK